MANRYFPRTRLCTVLLLMAGCDDPVGQQVRSLRDENRRLSDRLASQAEELTAANATIERQRVQIQSLQALGGPERLKLLGPVAGISLASLSGGYDDDGIPGDDGIVLYLQPRDAEGDILKAAGDIQVRLLDLANPPAQQLINECRWTAGEARSAWYGRLMTRHYTLRCPWGSGGPPRHTSVTARVVFNDLLTGQGFVTVQPIEVKLAPPASTSRTAQ